MSTPTTDPRPLTPAESRALDALVEWRRSVTTWESLLHGSPERAAALDVALDFETAVEDAADAVVAEREVRRG